MWLFVQKDALMLLKKSTNFLAKMKKRTSEEINVGNEINVNILTGIGNVMMASSKQADVDVNDEDATTDRAKVSLHYHYMCSWCKKISLLNISLLNPLVVGVWRLVNLSESHKWDSFSEFIVLIILYVSLLVSTEIDFRRYYTLKLLLNWCATALWNRFWQTLPHVT